MHDFRAPLFPSEAWSRKKILKIVHSYLNLDKIYPLLMDTVKTSLISAQISAINIQLSSWILAPARKQTTLVREEGKLLQPGFYKLSRKP